MKYLILTIICLVAYCQLNAQTKSDDQDAPTGVVVTVEEPGIDEPPRLEEDLILECISVRWDFGHPHQILNRDCPPEQIMLHISKQRCAPYPNINGFYEILYEGEVIHQVPMSAQQYQTIAIDGSKLEFGECMAADYLNFTIRLHFQIVNPGTEPDSPTITSTISTRSVQLVCNGSSYTYEYYTNLHDIYPICIAEEASRGLTVCCNKSDKTTLRWDHIYGETTETSLDFSGRVAGTVNFPVPGTVNFPFSFSLPISAGVGGGISYSIKNSTIRTIRRDITLQADMGYCASLGLALYYEKIEVAHYVADCSPEGIYTHSEFYNEIYDIRDHACISPAADDCKNPGLLLRQGRNKNATGACTGYIEVLIENDESGPFTFFWQGPNGFTSDQMFIGNVPYGMYTLEVTDKCCNTYTETFFLCPNESFTEWEKDASTGQYCRERYCEGCTDAFPECVDPEYGPWMFNADTKNCERTVYLNGEELTEPETKAATYEDEYDDFFNECVRTYYCDDTPFTETADPTYSDWAYDDFAENCYREVICFGDQAAEIPPQQAAPTVDWEYDDFFGQCVGYVYCDDSFFSIEELSESPSYGNWEYDAIYQECIATVFCGDGEDTGQFAFEREVVDAELDQNYFICELEISCGGEIFYESENITTAAAGTDNNGNALCDVFCAGVYQLTEICSVINDLRGTPGLDPSRRAASSTGIAVAVFPNPFTDRITIGNLPVDRPVSARLFNLDGKLLRTLSAEAGSLQMEMPVQEIASGLYLLEISDPQKIIYRRKIVKMP